MKTKSILSLLALLPALALSSSAEASGFRCRSEEGYRVKLYNHIEPTKGTRIPALLVISSAAQGTLLVREEEEIGKSNNTNVVRYTVEGDPSLNAEQVILQIRYKEGSTELLSGETAPGQLIFVNHEQKALYSLSCERYLKGETE